MRKQALKYIRDQYVIRQVQRAEIPTFGPDRVCRYRITFFGRVQKVGFRLEASELAARLGLTGFCGNLPDGSVVAELQGPENKIRFLVSFLASVKRIRITNKVMEELPVLPEESGFVQR